MHRFSSSDEQLSRQIQTHRNSYILFKDDVYIKNITELISIANSEYKLRESLQIDFEMCLELRNKELIQYLKRYSHHDFVYFDLLVRNKSNESSPLGQVIIEL